MKQKPVFPVISYLVTDDLKVDSGQLDLIIWGLDRPLLTLMLAIDNSEVLRNDSEIKKYKKALLPAFTCLSQKTIDDTMDVLTPKEWHTLFDTLDKFCSYLQDNNYLKSNEISTLDYLVFNTINLITEEVKYFCFVFKKANEKKS